MIRVYTAPGCGPCIATKRALSNDGLDYRTVDLSRDAEALAKVTAWGYRQAPVVEAGPDEHWSGFRPDLIGELIEG